MSKKKSSFFKKGIAEAKPHIELKDHTTDLNATKPKNRIYYDKIEECIAQDDELTPQSTKSLSKDSSIEPRELEANKEDEEKLRKQNEENEKKYAEQRAQLINEYLNDGPLVYELYSILVHSGGAYGGHYFAFIKSFEDNKWYNFDDSTVRPLDYNDIPSRVFGGSNRTANGYMLMYKQLENAEEKTIQISDSMIPEYIKKMCEEEDKKYLEQNTMRIERQMQMNLKVYHQLEVKFIPISMKDTLNDLLEKALISYGLQNLERKYVRLRSYVPHTDTLTEVYTGRENQTLESLKIHSTKCLAIEVRKEGQEFEDYDSDNIMFKIALWREGLNEWDEDSLKPKKVFVKRNSLLIDLLAAVAHSFDIPLEKLRLIKKVNVHGIQTAELLSSQDKLDKDLVSCKIFENMLLYAEEFKEENDIMQWSQEFEKESYRYKIKFSNPYKENCDSQSIEYPHTISIDCRSTFNILKKSICDMINVNANQVIMKRGGKNGMEIKDIDKTLQMLNFVNGSSLYVEFGIPSLPGESRIYFSLATKLNPVLDSVSHKFEELFELPISGDLTGSQVKEIVCEKIKELKNLSIDKRFMRLRERVSERMIRVYRDVPLKTQGIFDKKQIAIEILDHEDKQSQKEALVSVRLWNPETLDLSDIIEIIVDKNGSLRTFGLKLCERDKSIKIEDMEGCRIMAIYNFNRSDLLTQEWFNLDDEENVLSSHPFYISNDGFTIFVKDKNKKIGEFTEEDKKKLGILNQKNKKAVTFRPKAEKPLKITVKKVNENSQGTESHCVENETKQEGGAQVQSNIKVEEEKMQLEEEELKPLGD